MGPKMFLGARDSEITEATAAIEAGGSNAQKVAAYIKRGHAYSEKSRYTRVMNKGGSPECESWFAQAIKDHDQAVALDPKNAEAYYKRGEAYLDRGGAELIYTPESKVGKPFFDLAGADFKKAIELDDKNYLAWDRLGMVHMSTAQYDDAIVVFEKEMKLNQMGKSRLADAYCNRGGANHRAQKIDAAIADYEKSLSMGVPADSCECNPRLPLAELKKTK